MIIGYFCVVLMTIGTIIAKYGLPKTLSLCFEGFFYAKRSKEMKAALFQILNREVNHRRIGQLMPIFVCVLSLGACSVDQSARERAQQKPAPLLHLVFHQRRQRQSSLSTV